jgi:hypothetical protein
MTGMIKVLQEKWEAVMAEPCKQSHGGAMRPTEPDKKHDKEVLPEKWEPVFR